MSDGAMQGIGPERAIRSILGGAEPPREDEQQTVEEMAIQIRRAPLTPANYNDCGLACARIVLEYLEQHPEDAGVPCENIYDRERWHSDGDHDLKEYQLAEGLYDRIKRRDPGRGRQLVALGLTGFLWGWGYNAAHRVLGLAAEPNPAILRMRE